MSKEKTEIVYDCRRCGGSGTITEVEGHDGDEELVDDFECPDCMGTGKSEAHLLKELKEKTETLIEGDYVILHGEHHKAVAGLAALLHIEAANLPHDPEPGAFLGRLTIDTPCESVYDTIVKKTVDPIVGKKLRVRIELVTESE